MFFFLYPIFFWFLPSFPFVLHIFFPFPSLLLWRPFSFPFFLSLSLLLSFSPLLFGAPLRPPGVQAHAMHPPGYATALFTSMCRSMHGKSCPKSQLKSTCLTTKSGSFLDHAETGEKVQNVISPSVQHPTSLIFSIHVSFIIPVPMMWILLTKPMQNPVTTVCYISRLKVADILNLFSQ